MILQKNLKTRVVNFSVIGYDPFFNINNTDDLEKAEKIYIRNNLRLKMSFYDTLHKKHIVAKPGFNSWLVPPASIAIHLCIGSVYAWSMFNPALVKILGVVTSSGDDWNLGQVVWIFSVAIVSLGLLQHMLENGLKRLGPGWSVLYAACCWGGGFLIGSLGIYLQEMGVQITHYHYHV